MARVLQIRRGNASQNDNFTGMAGEITMDTDAKTLRVHDGETLGGFALARAGDGGGNGDFDIGSVSDEFWAALFARMSPHAPEIMMSPEIAITNTSGQEYIFDTTRTPIFANVVLRCKSAECGYSAGDTVASFGIGARTNPAPLTYASTDGLHCVQMVGGEAFWVSHHNTGITTKITPENWRAIFRVYC